MPHPLIPELPYFAETREEFDKALDFLFEFYCEVEEPIRINGWGFWAQKADEDKIRHRHAGVMFSVFEAPRGEPIGSVRTKFPLPEGFELVDVLKNRLRDAGRLVSYIEGDEATHVLEIRRPGIPDQTWEYGIKATDAQAMYLFLLHDSVSMRRVIPETSEQT